MIEKYWLLNNGLLRPSISAPLPLHTHTWSHLISYHKTPARGWAHGAHLCQQLPIPGGVITLVSLHPLIPQSNINHPKPQPVYTSLFHDIFSDSSLRRN